MAARWKTTTPRRNISLDFDTLNLYQTVMRPQYIYQPLDKPTLEFRLLQISKHPRTHQPQCSLRKYKLATCPEYTALSYTWGDSTPNRSVTVDGANLKVRKNLFDFLHAYTTEVWGMGDVKHGTAMMQSETSHSQLASSRRRRRRDTQRSRRNNVLGDMKKPVLYWIDQMCINQEDLVERSDQVRIMDRIYKQAKGVLVWLGCDPTMIEAARRLRDKVDDGNAALDTLSSHPYFSRIWIVQEIALNVNSPLIVCGGIELNWDCLRFVRTFPLSVHTAATATIYVRDQLPKRRNLEGYIRHHCKSDCHDPRDKVYGLLGLTPERWRVRVDYTKEVLEVYFDAVAAMCEELFDLSDPESFYPEELTVLGRKWDYRYTSLVLGEAMGVPQQQRCGLKAFLHYVQTAYLSTKIRNIQYTYTGRIYTRVQAELSSEQFLASEEEGEELEVKWGSITATRRNPLMRDIIPEMGLQLASMTADSIVGQSGDSVPVVDRWWCKHNGEIHYFDCLE